MHLFLIIVMFQSGSVTSLPFSSVDSCINAMNTITQKVSSNAGFATCIIDKGDGK